MLAVAITFASSCTWCVQKYKAIKFYLQKSVMAREHSSAVVCLPIKAPEKKSTLCGTDPKSEKNFLKTVIQFLTQNQ